MIEVYDHEVLQIEQAKKDLEAHAQGRRNYEDFDREIKEKFASIGFAVTVNWYTAANPDNTEIEGVLIPDITVDGRIGTDGAIAEPGTFTFDHDRQVHEVTHDLLELGDEASSVIKTGPMDSAHRDILAAHKHHKH